MFTREGKMWQDEISDIVDMRQYGELNMSFKYNKFDVSVVSSVHVILFLL